MSGETIDWEKEAKKTVQLDIEPRPRRKTIYELDSYSSSGPSAVDILKLHSMDIEPEPPEEIRYSTSMVGLYLNDLNSFLFLSGKNVRDFERKKFQVVS